MHYICLIMYLVPVALSQCPAGFEEVGGTWCHAGIKLAKSYSASAAYCASMAEGGKLVDLETREEMVALSDAFESIFIMFI